MKNNVLFDMYGRIVSQDNQDDIIFYGFNLLWQSFINMSTTLLIGLVTGKLTRYLLFYVCFMPIRKFMGGYHAKTKIRCYIMSVIMTILAVELGSLIAFDYRIYIALISFFIFLVPFLPVACVSKPLSRNEIKYFRIIGISLFLLQYIIALYLGILEFKEWVVGEMIISMSYSELLTSIELVKKRFKRNQLNFQLK